MKVCPVCKTRCFDDMAVCYGCLHDFSQDPPSPLQGAYGQVCIDDDLGVDETPVSWSVEHSSICASRGESEEGAAGACRAEQACGVSSDTADCTMSIPMMTVVNAPASSSSDARNGGEVEFVIPWKKVNGGCRVVVSIV